MKFEIAPKSTEIESNWFDAKLYCFSLNIDGKTGWRLPTRAELNEIYESDNDFVICTYYWTSAEFSGTGAWTQLFINGIQNFRTKDYDKNQVRAVRDLA
jgi:hypothetical protein